MNPSLSLSLRLELWLFALFQMAWAGVCAVALTVPHQLTPQRAGNTGLGSLFGVVADLNEIVLGFLAVAYLIGSLTLFLRQFCGLLPTIGVQLLLSLMFLYVTLILVSEETPRFFLSNNGMTMLGVLAMSCGILWRLLVFHRTLVVPRASQAV
jgi:hypothetical protein